MSVTDTVPALRFPEFEGEWSRKRLGEIATFQRGFDLPNQNRRDGTIPIVSSAGISGYHDKAKVERPGIVTGRYGSIGELFYLKEPHWPLNTALWVKDFHGNSIDFAFYHLSRVDFGKLSDKTGVPGINRNDLHRLWASTTTLSEQKKIAAFLGVVDAKIAALRARRAGLERYKRGLMQALFSQRLRFTKEDGSLYPDWEEKRLGDLLSVRYGKDHKALPDGDIPVLGTGGIMRSVDRSLHNGPSVLIGRKGTIDKPSFVTEPFWTVDTLFYSDIHAPFIPYFVFLTVQSVNWLRFNEATGVPSLSASAIHGVKVIVPTTPEEQQKIADALQALDAKIAAVGGQVDKMEAFKKGLLQQMFV